MGLGPDNDPFLWDVDRLVQELCTPSHTWNPPESWKLLDAASMKEGLLSEEVNGESLLTYQHYLGSIHDLALSLHIKKVPHRIAFVQMVRSLQKRSLAYRQWKKHQGQTHAESDMEEDNPGRSSKQPGSNPDAGLQSNPANPEGASASEPPNKKQKRLLPSQISAMSINSQESHATLAGADFIARAQTQSPANSPPGCPPSGAREIAYLGPDGLSNYEILYPPLPSDQDSGDQYARARKEPPPPGRRLQVHDVIKAHLRDVAAQLSGLQISGDEEEVLPLYGESDDEFDLDTMREIEEEEEHRARAAAARQKTLTKDEIAEVIREAIQTFEECWAVKKKPGCERDANRLWNDCRRLGDRKTVVEDATAYLKAIDTRIGKLCDEISCVVWANKKQAQTQTQSLEESVFQREKQRWLIAMLNSPIEPPRPEQRPKRKRPVSEPLALADSDGDEILTSDDDYDLEDFIVDDDNGEGNGMEVDIPPIDSMELACDDPDGDDQNITTPDEDNLVEVAPKETGPEDDDLEQAAPDGAEDAMDEDEDSSNEDETAHDEDEDSQDGDDDVQDEGQNVPDDDEGPNSSSPDDELRPQAPSVKKRRSRKVVYSQATQNRQKATIRQQKEYEARRQLLHEQVAASVAVPDSMKQLIINDGKNFDDGKGYVYVPRQIADRIKSHQLEGVRFMWNQLVVNRQGCLLAHTMGLGKTMQVITLLAAIAEASRSEDESISSQVPDGLKESQTLVLCPSGIVENWMEELRLWTPRDSTGRPILGEISSVYSRLQWELREQNIRDWASDGGILLIGYPLFNKICRESKELAKILWRKPNIVIADEAHAMKNEDSQLHATTAKFTTKNRIAMTGTPLANNVKDYYAMINWVEPGYLGSPKEFGNRYDGPIKLGLWSDSSAYEKRRALKLLSALRQLVAPMVHRMGIAAIKDDLPPKKEFIIYLRLTDLQMEVYKTYTGPFVENYLTAGKVKSHLVWKYIAFLTNLHAHPSILKKLVRKRLAAIDAGESERRQRNRNASTDEEERAMVDINPEILRGVLTTLSVVDNIKNYALSWKVMTLLRIIEEAKRLGEKVLVFSQSIAALDFMEAVFRRQGRKFERLDGNTAVAKRQTQVKNFNKEDDLDVYLISTKAGGVGLNIYGASRVVIFDFKFVPTDEQQAIARAFRLGQRKEVFVYWLIAGGTFEEVIQNRAVFKTQLSSRVVDRKSPIAWSTRFGDYFSEPKIPPKAGNLSGFQGKDAILDALLSSEDLADGIRSIIMTDTFEEEEPDEHHALTNEEAQEVSALIADNHRRIRRSMVPAQTAPMVPAQPRVVVDLTLDENEDVGEDGDMEKGGEDAEEDEESEEDEDQDQDEDKHKDQDEGQDEDEDEDDDSEQDDEQPMPQATGGRAKSRVQRASNGSQAPRRIQVAQSKRHHPTSTILGGRSLPSRAAAPSWSPQPPPARATSSRNRDRSGGPSQSSDAAPHQAPDPDAALLPIAGQGTHMHTSPASTTTSMEVAIATKKKDVTRALMDHAKAFGPYKSRTMGNPGRIVENIQVALDEQSRPIQGIELLDRWSVISETMRSRRVAELLLTLPGFARTLAAMQRVELDTLAAHYNSMTPPEFEFALHQSLPGSDVRFSI